MTRYSETSEKALEVYLKKQVEARGGRCLKYSNPSDTGYPDRLCLLGGGRTFWVELKSRGRKPRRLQLIRHEELRALGQRVFVADSKDAIDKILDDESFV